ncbi:MAG TPA: hypothetical protein VJP77_06615 [Planctomycetota bacterium]|nr:hypothetical protein [Planctomycetota bacterium]
MTGILRFLVRGLVIGGIGLGALAGGTLLLAGPDRAHTLFSQVHHGVVDTIDRHLDEHQALRHQLRELEQEYPERISQLSADMAELNGQIAQLEREQRISARVVELADADLADLEQRLDSPDNAVQPASYVRFDGRQYSYDQAANRATQIRQTRVVYAQRATEAERDLGYLHAQSERMQEALTQLETERMQFQAQLQQLELQVDAIERNERLIAMMEEREQALEACSRYDAVDLDHVVARLSEVRNRQEAELQLLASDQQRVSYEDQARIQLEEEQQAQASARNAYALQPAAPHALAR